MAKFSAAAQGSSAHAATRKVAGDGGTAPRAGSEKVVLF